VNKTPVDTPHVRFQAYLIMLQRYYSHPSSLGQTFGQSRLQLPFIFPHLLLAVFHSPHVSRRPHFPLLLHAAIPSFSPNFYRFLLTSPFPPNLRIISPFTQAQATFSKLSAIRLPLRPKSSETSFRPVPRYLKAPPPQLSSLELPPFPLGARCCSKSPSCSCG